MITPNQYALTNNLPDYIETWLEIEELTGKNFTDITLEIAASLPTAEVVDVVPTLPTKIPAKKLAPVVPAANSLESLIAAAVAPYMPANNAIDEDAVIELIKQHAPIKHIEIKVQDITHVVGGKQHEMFEVMLKIIASKCNVYIYGPAGTGKTQMAENASMALGKTFTSISVCSQSTKGDFFGFTDANGKYVTTLFRQTYENGGVFLIDEIDNGNANILSSINAAISNGYCAFGDGMVRKHEDFICIAAANTFGTGATRQYVGRNQLGAELLNRFVPIEVGYDEKLEIEVFGDIAKKVQKIRKEYKDTLTIISMRNIAHTCKLMAVGFTETEAIKMAVYNTISPNILKK